MRFSGNGSGSLIATPQQAERLRELLAMEIVGEGRIVVGRRGNQIVVGLRKTPIQSPTGEGDFFLVRVELDPSTAALTGSPTTQCGFKYWAYPASAVAPFDPALRIPDGVASPSRLDYRGHMSIGPYVAAATGTFGMAFYDGVNLRLIAWKEQPAAEACS